MNNYIIYGTETTPEIKFDYNNKIIIFEGVSLPEYGNDFYDDVEKKIVEFVNSNSNNITIIFNLVFINTSSNNRIYNILKFCIDNVKNFRVIWKYEKNNDVILEHGEIYEKALNFKFKFIEY